MAQGSPGSILKRRALVKRRNCRGGAVVEAAGSLALLMPIIILTLFAVIEVAEYFVLKQDLSYIARGAAKEICDEYHQGETLNLATITSMNTGYPGAGSGDPSNTYYAQILNQIMVPAVLNGNSIGQFQTFFPAASNPQYVRVQVQYANGPNLPTFPWSPLGAGLAPQFNIGAGLLSSACVWCVPHSTTPGTSGGGGGGGFGHGDHH